MVGDDEVYFNLRCNSLLLIFFYFYTLWLTIVSYKSHLMIFPLFILFSKVNDRGLYYGQYDWTRPPPDSTPIGYEKQLCGMTDDELWGKRLPRTDTLRRAHCQVDNQDAKQRWHLTRTDVRHVNFECTNNHIYHGKLNIIKMTIPNFWL